MLEAYEGIQKFYGEEELDEFFDESDLDSGKTTMTFLIESINAVNTLVCSETTPLIIT